MAATQENRSIAISTALGKDKLLMRSFKYEEAMNRPFIITATVYCEDSALPLDSLVGTPASIQITTAEGDKVRYLHGLVDRVTQGERVPGYAIYVIEMIPWLKFLDKTSDCRIFQDKSVPDIISEVFQKAGFSDFELKLTGNYKPREYCVQYRETSYNFVSRLMEHEGIGCHFKHEKSKHTLVLTDAIASHKPFPGYATVPYRESESASNRTECIHSWDFTESARTGKYAQTDYNFKTPKAAMLATEPQPKGHGLAGFERFDYPGAHEDMDAGQRLAKMRLEALQAEYQTITAVSRSRGLVIGKLFTLQDHPRDDQNIEYLITSIVMEAMEGSFTTGSNSMGFSCRITALPGATPYRPPIDEKKIPIIAGPQTAIVTGPKGDEIHTDEHGRVTVQFFWDRYGKNDQNSSCWIRVSQTWAGKGWGAMHIPRIGQEVIVEHLEGNPDRPLITGRVYNADLKPPYPLPAKKTISGLRSNTTPEGQPAENYNEILMDDTKGAELLSIQAEKDCKILVKHDRTEEVKHDEVITIGENRAETVGKDEKVEVAGNRTIQVGKKLTLKAGDEIEIITGSASITMKSSGAIEIKGTSINVGGQATVTVKGGIVKVN